MLIAACLWINSACADSYKVLFVNDTNLKYTNGKVVKKGDVISDVSTINWEKERQAVKVINQSTKRITLFTGKNWVRAKGSGAMVYIKHTSTQITDDNFYAKLFSIFDSQYDLMDKIEVSTDIELSDNCYFTAAYMYGDTKLVKKLGHEDDKVIIDMSLFNIDGKVLEPRDIEISIEYVNERDMKTISVRDGIDIFIIPETVD